MDFWDQKQEYGQDGPRTRVWTGKLLGTKAVLQNWKYSYLSPVVSSYPAGCQGPGLWAYLSECVVPKSLPKGCLSPRTLNLHVLQYLACTVGPHCCVPTPKSVGKNIIGPAEHLFPCDPVIHSHTVFKCSFRDTPVCMTVSLQEIRTGQAPEIVWISCPIYNF